MGLTRGRSAPCFEHHRRLLLGSGRVDPRQLEVLSALVRKQLAHPGFAQWWRENPEGFDDEFARWIDAISLETKS